MKPGWKMVTLGEVCPASPSKRECPDSSHIWNLTLDQVEADTGKISKRQYIQISDASSSTNFVDEENVLYSKLRPYLNKVVVPDEFACATSELVPLKPNPEKLNKWFLVHYLRSKQFVSWASNAVAGAKMPRLTMKEFWKHEIPLPPMEEQRRIVAILDAAQALIDQRKQQIALMDQLVQSLFYDMFGDPVTNPMGWEEGMIKDLAVKTQYGTSKKAHETDGEYPILRMNNITYIGGWDFRSLKFVDFDAKEKEKYLVHKGEILFNRTNSKELVGKTAVYREETPMAYAGYLVKLIVNERADPEYISAYLNSKHGKSVLLNKAKSIVGMANINAEELKKIEINIPPITLQQEFAERVTAIEAQKTAMSASLSEQEDLFAALNQRAFRGEL
ncbi:restriction endonuclease subunit S [Pontiellaceae bacterium B12219]|nr:restriction endonuclease subunit S [Pontiellaceae bacterium B12219]